MAMCREIHVCTPLMLGNIALLCSMIASGRCREDGTTFTEQTHGLSMPYMSLASRGAPDSLRRPGLTAAPRTHAHCFLYRSILQNDLVALPEF
jgi:hypothetical protein